MKNLIIGIDGGGTKSHLAVFDQTGKCVTVGKHGPLNHEVMEDSFTQLEKELSAFIKETLAGIGAVPADVAFAVMGIAGVDTEKQHAVISAMVERIGLPHFILCNDAFLGVPAGCKGGVGICAINGTGSSMAAVDHSNATVQVGGIGPYSNDCGGSSWYSFKLLGAVYGELFKFEPKTIMTRMLFERLGIKDAKDYVEKITADIEDGSLTLSELNIMVFQAVAQNDPVAISFLQESAEHYAGGIAHLASTLDFPDDQSLYVTLAGSVFVKEKTQNLLDLLKFEIAKRLPRRNVEFQKLHTVPVAGAVYWAGKEAGFKIDIDIISKSLAEAGL
ncbi:MAG: hypothetical protein FWE14_06225 [Lachnospiraceae bacterium]|nr:hypothetical protein [Lachnospiraceae bacterium]